MKILVINCGSSSLKYQLIDSETTALLAKGLCERIGADGSSLTHEALQKEKITKASPMPDHTAAVSLVLEMLTDAAYGAIKTLDEIGAAGHRVVHGAEYFSKATLIDESVLSKLEECSDLAPLHNPGNISGIRACLKNMPKVPMVAVFDTAFHQTIPEEAFLYALPYQYYTDYKIRRYGFHGVSHEYVSRRAESILGKKLKTIVCHLGNGASVTAVKYGQSIDTSMGMTPLEGLAMGTRSGDIDPAILQYLAHKENKNIDELTDILNKKSGVLGISGISNDFRDLGDAAKNGDKSAKRALDVYSYRLSKYIGSYIVALGGADCICFTAGVGENNQALRSDILKKLEFLGCRIDEEKNSIRGEEVIISAPDSSITVMVIPTNEELSIALQTKECIA